MFEKFDVRIDNQLGRDFQLCLVERPDIPTAKQKIQTIEVPGRDGPLTKKEGFEDVSFKLLFNLLEDYNIKPLLRKIKAWLMQSKILSFTDDDVYRKIKQVEIGDINNEIEEYGMFEVNFVADPYEYAIMQPFEVTAPVTLANYGTYAALPKLTIYGTGDITIYVNGTSFQLKGVKDSIIVDSDLKEAYSGTMPMNDHMIGKFPVLDPGEVEIKWNGTVKKIELEARWRYI